MILGLDIGTSAVKAAVLRGERVVGRIARVEYPTRFQGPRVEVNPAQILTAISRAIAALGATARRVDALALSVMSPAWIAMDRRGKPLTPIITHQDRRSLNEAIAIEARLGKARHLSLAGVRPVPGGISSTTWAWFQMHHRSLLKRADLVGHLNTFLIRAWTGQRVIDPSNASFMGAYSLDLSGWNPELCENVQLPETLLPNVVESDRIAGTLTREAASGLRLKVGLPVLAGMIDTSAAMLLAGARAGQLLNTCGSTDVLAILTHRPRPHEHLITRAFGIGRRWISVNTIAAAGSSILWAREQLFADYSWPRFTRLVNHLAKKRSESLIEFAPHLAGDRMSIEQQRGAFRGLTLSSSRQQMLESIINSLAAASAARLPLLRAGGTKLRRRVIVTGRGFDHLLHRDWPGQWEFVHENEATLRGLGLLLK